MKSVWDTEPYHINEIGVKFWVDKDTNEYLHKADRNGITLNELAAWFVELNNGHKERILINNQSGQVIYNSQQLDAIGTYIDVLKLLKKEEQCKDLKNS